MSIDLEDYEYDVFISYLCTNPGDKPAPTCTWVREYLYPELEMWLPEHVEGGRPTPIFFDKIGIKTGDDWRLHIQDALQTSRCLLAVFTSQYFGSPWCQAELNTILEREKELQRQKKLPRRSGLIYPIYLSGEPFIPARFKNIQMKKNLKEFYRTDLNFKTSEKYSEFQRIIREEVCLELSTMFLAVPDWDRNWPVVQPEEKETPTPTITNEYVRLS